MPPQRLSGTYTQQHRPHDRRPRVNRKVLYVHANSEEVGGADYCLFKMALEMRSRGWAPSVVLRTRTRIVSLYEDEGIPLRLLPLVRVRKTTNPLKLVMYLVETAIAIKALVAVIRAERPDIVHTNDLMDFPSNFAAYVASVPSCQHVRMIVTRPAWLRKALALISQTFSTSILCVSRAVADTLYGGASTRVQVLHDWLDMEATRQTSRGGCVREELELPTDSRIIACFGRLAWWKGQHVFLGAAETLLSDRPDVYALIVGGPTAGKEDYEILLRRRHAESPFGSRVRLLGERTDIASLMRQSDVVVHSSLTPDPLPGVVMEAMSQGSVVVAANAGGVPEEIVDGTGFLYAAGDRSDLARQIGRALDTPNRDEIGAAAQKHVRATFAKAAISLRLAVIYENLAASAR